MPRNQEDERLVAALVAALDAMSPREAEAEAGGVGLSHETVRKYRSGEWTRLNAETRRKIRDYLRRRPIAGGSAASLPLTEADEKRIAAKWMERTAKQLREDATALSEAEKARLEAGKGKRGKKPDARDG